MGVNTSSRVVLFFATLLFAYFSVAMFCAHVHVSRDMAEAHRHYNCQHAEQLSNKPLDNNQKHRHELHRAVLHFTTFGVMCGLVGILAAFLRSPRVSMIYSLMLLVLLVVSVHGLSHHLHAQMGNCATQSVKTRESVEGYSVMDMSFFRIITVHTTEETYVDEGAFRHCSHGVTQVYVLGVAIVTTVLLSMSYCAASFSNEAVARLKKTQLKRSAKSSEASDEGNDHVDVIVAKDVPELVHV
eukprot:PhM_4_TR13333/c1_g1_i3/m.17406